MMAMFVLNNYYYEVEKIDYKYTVDYINSHSKGMFKVGFSMTSKKEKLQNKIERFIIASNKFEYSLLDDQ